MTTRYDGYLFIRFIACLHLLWGIKLLVNGNIDYILAAWPLHWMPPRCIGTLLVTSSLGGFFASSQRLQRWTYVTISLISVQQAILTMTVLWVCRNHIWSFNTAIASLLPIIHALSLREYAKRIRS